MSRFAFALLFAAAAFAQPGAPRIVSPEVLPDHRITFRISAPKTTEAVLMFGDANPKSYPMTKGQDGVWSVTLGPFEPEVYPYYFMLDGAKAVDLSNPIMKVGTTVDASLVEVRGDPPRFDQVQEVPHGSINIHTYASSVAKTQRGLYVYVPAEYYTQPAKRYPVLYLWHGGGGAEQDWSRDGRAGVILDNLIAQKKAVPMLIIIILRASIIAGEGTFRKIACIISREEPAVEFQKIRSKSELAVSLISSPSLGIFIGILVKILLVL